MKRTRLLTLLGGICLVAVLAALPFMEACAKPAPAPTPAPAPAPAPVPAPVPVPAPSPAPEKVIELKFAHFNPPDAWANISWSNPWCKKIEEVTKGRVKVTIYPAGTLAKEREIYPAIEGGVADMGWVVLPFYKGRFPCTEVTSLPFLALEHGKVDGVTYSSGKIHSHMLWTLYEKFPEMQAEWSKTKLLYLIGSSTAFISTAKKPVRNQTELKGLKLRALAGGQTDALKALGASPVAMPIPEVYEATQRGVLDGMATQWAQIASQRFYDVFSYYTLLPLDATEMAVPMNPQKWSSLPKDIQDAIMSISGRNGALFAGDTAWGFGERDAVFEGMKKAGKPMEEVKLDAGELEKWKGIAGKPLWDKWLAEMEAKGLPGKKLLDELLILIEKYRD